VLDPGRSGRELAGSPDGKEWAALTAEREFVRWDPAGKVLQKTILLGGDRPNTLAHVPGQAKVVVGLYRGQAVVVDAATGKIAARYSKREQSAGEEAITAAAAGRGGLAATNWLDSSLDVWQVEDGAWVRTLAHKPAKEGDEGRGVQRRRVQSLAFRPDGKQLAAVDTRGTLNLWDATRGELQFAGLQGPSQTTQTRALAYSPDGRRLVQGGQDESLVVWDPHTGKRVQQFRAHRAIPVDVDLEGANVTAAAYSPDGKWLATCGSDGTVRLWDTRDPDRYEPAAVLSAVRLGSYGSLSLGAEAILPNPDLGASLLSVAFSANGKELLVGGWNAPVRRYDVAVVLEELAQPAAGLLERTERRTAQRWQGSRLVPLQQNRLTRLSDPE
jgi:WD40 repeat protein